MEFQAELKNHAELPLQQSLHLGNVPSSIQATKCKQHIAMLLPFSSSTDNLLFFPSPQPEFVTGWVNLKLIALLAENDNSFKKSL